MATTVTVYPPPGTTYPDAAGVPITSAGAIVDNSKYIRDAIRDGYLLTYDPLGIYQPDDRTDTGGGGSGSTNSFAYASLLGDFVGSTGAVAFTDGALVRGDGGGGQWYWDSTDTTTVADNATCCGASPSGRWKRTVIDTINVRWFGAQGDDDQTLVPYSYSVNGGSFVYTQQTKDARAICQAIAYARANNIGSIYIPPGIYRVHGFLEDLNFNVRLYGAGAGVTILKSRDASPVNANGYGIIFSRPSGYQQVSVESMTLDGNVYLRGQPTGELVSYNAAFYDRARVRVTNVESLNAVTDCLLVHLDNDQRVSFTANNLWCSDAYRNVCSVISGDNIDISDSVFQKAGYPFNGTNPRYVIDIEPDVLTTALKGVRFSGCTFRMAYGVYLVGMVWSKAQFDGCIFDGSDGSPEGDGFPYLQGNAGCEVDFNGCTFKKVDTYFGHTENNYLAGGAYQETQYASFVDCHWIGAAPATFGPRFFLSGCKVSNSLYPFLIGHTAATTFKQTVDINGLQMVNVFDRNNYTGGEIAALFLDAQCRGDISLYNVSVVFDASKLPSDTALSNLWKSTASNGQKGYGIDSYANSSGTYESCVRMVNVSASGYTYDFPAFAGVSPSLNYADWHHDGNWPSVVLVTPPVDTAGQIAAFPGLWARNCTSRGA